MCGRCLRLVVRRFVGRLLLRDSTPLEDSDPVDVTDSSTVAPDEADAVTSEASSVGAAASSADVPTAPEEERRNHGKTPISS
jgi:hypothetical protein